MNDPVFTAFLRQQLADASTLAAESEILELCPVQASDSAAPVELYFARFLAHTLVRTRPGSVVEWMGFDVGIRFPEHYLRHVEPWQVVSWLAPFEVFHPNIRPPACCIGEIRPGTSLVDLLHRIYEIGTYQRVTMREEDSLNRDACPYVRGIRDRLPVDRRPLKRWIASVRPEKGERA